MTCEIRAFLETPPERRPADIDEFMRRLLGVLTDGAPPMAPAPVRQSQLFRHSIHEEGQGSGQRSGNEGRDLE